MENYFNRQRDSTLEQIDYLYKEKDVSFRGFRHHTSRGLVGEKMSGKSKDEAVSSNIKKGIKTRDNQVLDGMTNWEISSSDGDRFSKPQSNGVKGKSLSSFDEYIKIKKARIEARKITIINT